MVKCTPMASISLHSDSIFLPVSREGARLHLKHFWTATDGQPILMLHGSVENGRIFYSRSGKGLAPFLAQAGYDVYVLDLRGRGESTPPVGPKSSCGQLAAITEDLPTAMAEVWQRSGQQPLHLMGHSWGRVLFNATLARFPTWTERTRSLVYWGTKRRAEALTGEVRLKIRFFWERLAYLLTALYGYLPARRWRVGSDDETRLSHRSSARWTRPGSPFIDPEDGLDYGVALQTRSLPRGLYLIGANDQGLGHPDDVARFREECHHTQSRIYLLGTANATVMTTTTSTCSPTPTLRQIISRWY